MKSPLIITLLLHILAFCNPLTKATIDNLDNVINISPLSATKITKPMHIAKIEGQEALTTNRGPETRKGTEQSSEDGGKAVFTIKVKNGGDYTLIADAFWCAGDGNSFWIKVDSLPYEKFGNDGTEKKWISIRGPVFNLSAGTHTLTIREREWGAAIGNITLSPIPFFVSSALAFGNSVTVTDSNGYKKGRFLSIKQQLLIHPGYVLISEKKLKFACFYADTSKNGVLEADNKLPLSITDPTGKIIYSGLISAGKNFTIDIDKGIAGSYLIRTGDKTESYHNLNSRFETLRTAISAIKGKPIKSNDELLWLPTIELCKNNIERGYKLRHQSDVNIPNTQYVLAEFNRAEEILCALQNKRADTLLKSGIQELAHYSKIDSQLCPYTLYLPAEWTHSSKAHHFILYLHGTGGTQWEFERNMEARNLPISKLEHPMIVPFGRGNANWMKEAEKDLLTLITIAGKSFNLDTNNITLSGFSMGGYGTWHIGSLYPDKFKILVPVAGGLPWEWSRLKNPDYKAPDPILPPSWNGRIVILHAFDDEAVPFIAALEVSKKLAKAGKCFDMSVYSGGHTGPMNQYEIYNEIIKDRPLPKAVSPK
ncbi:MAG: prolyl oligopeptidase family serine peptidase [Fibrobacteres bacterium]|nr:prolyl oligopeptidase family serine peptidase [Fibrobacterota bacterium]